MSSDAAAATLLSEQDGIFAIKEESKTFSQWKRLSFGKTLVKHRGAPQRATERFRTSPWRRSFIFLAPLYWNEWAALIWKAVLNFFLKSFLNYWLVPYQNPFPNAFCSLFSPYMKTQQYIFQGQILSIILCFFRLDLPYNFFTVAIKNSIHCYCL